MFLSIFSKCTGRERRENFVDYWKFSQTRDGKIFEESRDLAAKQKLLKYFQDNPVRSVNPLPSPELFYKNYVHMQDNPQTLDPKTRLLTCIYKFARHEWVGISGAWDAIPSMADSKSVTDKISRYHLCEEFCHVRLFHEMMKTFHLDRVQWVPLGKWMQKIYGLFPYFPEWIMAAPAFVSELMGITFYQHVDKLLDTTFADEPQARNRVRELLHEIMVDEVAHIGQRRNFMGPLATRLSRLMVGPMVRLFFRDIPEAKYLFDVSQMVRDGLNFDYSTIRRDLMERTWVPSYCQTKAA